MQPTFHAYDGQVLHQGPGFSTNNFSDQDIAIALGRMRDVPEWMPGFLRHHRLTPQMVVVAINSANPEASDGRKWVELFVELYPQMLGKWYAANPLPDALA